MAGLNITVKHGQTLEAARASFQKAITQVHAEHNRWIRHVEWSADQSSAVLSGPSYQITLSFEEARVVYLALFEAAEGAQPGSELRIRLDACHQLIGRKLAPDFGGLP